MTWTQNIARWRRLPAETKLRRRWEAIPADVAESMAFEGEPVPQENIRATLDRIEPPASVHAAGCPGPDRLTAFDLPFHRLSSS